MRFEAGTPPRPRREAVVPMINVVFLLLIFFLMSAAVVPPDPVEVRLPSADALVHSGEADALYISAEGQLAYGTFRGEAALAAVDGSGVLDVRADARLPGADLARLIGRLAAVGITEIRLVTVGQ